MHGFGVFQSSSMEDKPWFLSSEYDILEIEVGGPFPEDPYLLCSVFSFYKFIKIKILYTSQYLPV